MGKSIFQGLVKGQLKKLIHKEPMKFDFMSIF